MTLPIKLISTDFDGTLHADFEDPPVPRDLENIIGALQAQGALWVINTGRDLSSLMETLGRARLSIWPDYTVTVEREIHVRHETRYVALEEWNSTCHRDHEVIFKKVREDLEVLTNWVAERFEATVYEDAYSPFCLIAKTRADADAIYEYLEEYARRHPQLAVVRNDVYARFSHVNYNKGAALAEICRLRSIPSEFVVAAGDHFNDLPMLSTRYAKWLIAPSNAIDVVKETVREQNGYVSSSPHGSGVARGLEAILEAGDMPLSRLNKLPK